MNPNTNPTKESESVTRYLDDARKGEVYWEERAILDFTEEILRRIEELNISKSDLAARLEVEPAYVSKLIRGSNNFTLRTMVRISRALASELRFHLQPIGMRAEWTDYNLIAEAAVVSVFSLAPASKFSPAEIDLVNGPESTITYATGSLAA